jgi:hypothetical protein
VAGAASGVTIRAGKRFFVRLGRFSLIAQYTRCTRLWFHRYDHDRPERTDPNLDQMRLPFPDPPF